MFFYFQDTPQSTPRSSSTETDKLNLTIERLSEEIQELNEENEELVGTIEALQCACMVSQHDVVYMCYRSACLTPQPTPIIAILHVGITKW